MRYTRGNKGFRPDLGHSCDSDMEANVGRVLQWMEDKGVIKDLERCTYSNPEHIIEFDVRHGITRTIVDYRFKYPDEDEWTWVEVKGAPDDRSRTRIKNMKRDASEIFDRTIFVVKRKEGVYPGHVPKGYRTKYAHAFLVSKAYNSPGAEQRQLWFYQDLRDQYKALLPEWQGD